MSFCQSELKPQALAAQYLRVASDIEEQIAAGMHFAVVCSEDAPRWSQQNVTEEALAKSYIGTAFMSGMRAVCEQLAHRPGPIVGVIGMARGETAIPLERLLIERAISVNTAAAGGNASLMTIG